MLEPFHDQLPEKLFTEPFTIPKSDGSGQNRENLLKAQQLLNEAGWIIRDPAEGIRRHKDTGEPLSIEIMLRQPTMQRVVAPMRRHFERLGIQHRLRLVDDAQYQKRVDTRDFDMISNWINRAVFFPGAEQMNYWHSSQADIEGSNNTVGLKNEVVDHLLQKLLNAASLQELKAAGRALDRVLLWHHLVIPHWHNKSFRIAYWDKFGLPEIQPKYSLGFNSWWVKKSGK